MVRVLLSNSAEVLGVLDITRLHSVITDTAATQCLRSPSTRISLYFPLDHMLDKGQTVPYSITPH